MKNNPKQPSCADFSLDALYKSYFEIQPSLPEQAVSFGTSGHRGSSLRGTFTQAHIQAITQAVCDYRRHMEITGPLYMGKDTHALSPLAFETALEVLVANGVQVIVQNNGLPTPTPVISHCILTHNRKSTGNFSDGIVITPSHNPPEDGGFKYNEIHGGPAGASATGWISNRANALLAGENRDVRRKAISHGHLPDLVMEKDLITPYVYDLANVLDMQKISSAGLRLGVDPLGGASLPYWEMIAEHYRLDLEIVNRNIDPCFSFMPRDHDGKIRMDCSSPKAMQGLVGLASRFDLAFANDPDADRHGIVTPKGLMSPNHYLSAAAWFLLGHRPEWNKEARLGKTVVTTHLIDRICRGYGVDVYETPVGFKWFVDEVIGARMLFFCEESAGGSFARFSGEVWTTDKDGLTMDLLAAEMLAVTGKDPASIYQSLTEQYGNPAGIRLDIPADAAVRKAFKAMNPSSVRSSHLAGEKIEQVQVKARGNQENFGGLKVVTANAWFAARPSGTEDIYKIYAESFQGESHLEQVVQEAQEIINSLL